MSQTLIWVQVNLWANRICGFFAIFNILWMIEMAINAFVQRKELNEWIEGTWKADLEICLGLSIVGLISLYLPALSGSFGREVYVMAGVAYVFQALFMWGYRKKLAKYIKESWYLNSTFISFIVSLIALITLVVFSVSSIVVFDY
ncbi:hypothetical protein [uncultured Lactobacillus sp.]|uniref:hypothetical protein n=1 Tax=uncultured Lactobacillus sp. TaxID=153152 RepID=UPI00262DC7A5|nr:hypothetical protein [uncultured Lactobacillus sp.]